MDPSRSTSIGMQQRHAWMRLGMMGLCAVALATAASIIGPAFTMAEAPAEPSAEQRAADIAAERWRAVKMPAFMGTLTGWRYKVDVYMTRNGSAYTVKDREGTILGEMLTSEALAARFPDLDIPSLHAGSESTQEADAE